MMLRERPFLQKYKKPKTNWLFHYFNTSSDWGKSGLL